MRVDFRCVQKLLGLLLQKAQKTLGNPKENITAMLTVTASGEQLPGMIVYANERISPKIYIYQDRFFFTIIKSRPLTDVNVSPHARQVFFTTRFPY